MTPNQLPTIGYAPTAPFEQWMLDNEYGNPYPGSFDTLTDATSPDSTKGTWQWTWTGGAAACGNGVGSVWYRISNLSLTQLYIGADYELSNPGQLAETHALYVVYGNNAQSVLDLSISTPGNFEWDTEGGGTDLFLGGQQCLALGNYFRIEMTINLKTQTGSLWCNGTQVANGVSLGAGTSFDHLQLDSVWGNCTQGTTPAATSDMRLAHIRVSGSSS